MAKRENTLPPHMRQMVETAEIKFKIPIDLANRLHQAKKMCKDVSIELDVDEALAKALERLVRQTEKYFEARSGRASNAQDHHSGASESSAHVAG